MLVWLMVHIFGLRFLQKILQDIDGEKNIQYNFKKLFGYIFVFYKSIIL